MQKLIKNIADKLYQPLVAKYLSTTRKHRYKGIVLQVPPQVFHPGFFFSTKLLLQFLDAQNLKGKSLLELGAGSGLIAMYTARNGTIVTASDINEIAIDFLKKNSEANNIAINIIHSNLFMNIPKTVFDYIIINPPYYKKNPKTPIDYAWYCGENGEYFIQLFNELSNHVNKQSNIIMVLSDACDISMIKVIALQNGWELNCVLAKTNWLETNFIFMIQCIKQKQPD